ncbi:glutathione-disulfide reductase [Propylenella binzhouense]|uniref:Glutathione reductase n=1 Tax=Propylenella binzhouense TaxID=2555902 RepID=A0A964T2T9_9HYPH|nr:glutathione-disulfide reductase [Propylenella binzhouense]MYZ47456.1 glutathione-disulfide reductase [Propylenella binzhouense]
MARDYDLFVIGAGSGGVRAARKAAEAGARVAIAEADRVGGTCVIRGCVPKKLFVYASQFSEAFEDSAGYGWTLGEARFDWPTLVANKDREIARLEGIYRANLGRAGVELFESRAVLAGGHEVRLEALGRTVTADTILVATGGRPNPHADLPGHEHCITSNEAFHLDRLPEKVLIAGGGYIAVEFAGIFNGLGVDTTLVYRGPELLSRFDMDLRRLLHAETENKGIRVRCKTIFSRIEKLSDGRLRALLSDGSVEEADAIMLAVGRLPNSAGLGLAEAGVKLNSRGGVIVDEYSRTAAGHIWAIGDVTDRLQLTPVAIHEAMCFVETVYRGRPTRPDHDLVATAVFSHPEIGTVGLTEDEARKRHRDLDIYKAVFRPMRHTLSGRSDRMLLKLVVEPASGKVLGAHVLGPDAGEMAQLLGIPLKMGATIADFDRTMAVHPTAAEELVTFSGPTERIRSGETVAA